MEIIKNLECVDYTSEGDGVVKHNGIPIFVRNLIVGEIADVKVTYKKKTLWFGEIQNLVTKSPARKSGLCDVQEKCGGCQILHIDYENQTKFKKNRLQNVFRNYGVEVEYFQSPVIYNYRNKIQLPMGPKGEFGFYAPGTNDIIPYNECLMEPPYVKEILDVFRKHNIKGFDKYRWKGLVRHVLIRWSKLHDQYMVCIVATRNEFSDKFLNDLESLSKVKSIYFNRNDRRDNVILGDKFTKLRGDEVIYDSIGDIKFAISPESFFQINNDSAKIIYDIVKENVDSEDVIIDAYCGVGTIGIYVADKAKSVIGVEINKKAIQDAKQNAKDNNVSNITFTADDATYFIEDFDPSKFNTVILDPPRKGTTREFIYAVADADVKKVIYVSCDPATCERDVRQFAEEGYKVVSIAGIDMFPNTSHIETVVVLKK